MNLRDYTCRIMRNTAMNHHNKANSADADRTDRSLMLAWPSAIRPIGAVERLLFPSLSAPLALRLSRPLEQTPPFGRLRFAWFLARIIASGCNVRSQKRQLNSDVRPLNPRPAKSDPNRSQEQSA